MLPNNRGFFLLELLLSLSACFMIGLFFFPLFNDLTKQLWQLEVNKKANQLLFEELSASLIDGHSFASFKIVHNDVEYQVIWREGEVPNQKEVCIKVEQNNLSQTEWCSKPE